MNTKEKGLFIGIGVLVGIGIGVMAFKNFKIVNVGNINELTIVHKNDGDVHRANTKAEEASL
ncbi:hypothetical protein [Aquibacillus kalidii]|uniref:hypothetical protein n=1 Tax=Aquibacillus kalidii TaxID=2762597 RepID=UPI0016445243|nr:hypothetical protein [Aquibacillus kalidii]